MPKNSTDSKYSHCRKNCGGKDRKIDLCKIIDEALSAGFTLAAPFDPQSINLMAEVREMCAVNKCAVYGTNWACPPACGPIDECMARVRKYTRGIIVQTTGQLEDDFDAEGMIETAKKHSETFQKFTMHLRDSYDFDMLPLAAGGCSKCSKCTYPDEPCRFPKLMVAPMEGYGIYISDLCSKNNIEYYHGRGTLTYVGCYLFA